MDTTDINQLADDILAVIGQDAEFFRNATINDVGELLRDIAHGTDAPAEDSNHAWRVWRTDAWYHNTCSASEREHALREIRRQLEHGQTAWFIGRWKGMTHS